MSDDRHEQPQDENGRPVNRRSEFKRRPKDHAINLGYVSLIIGIIGSAIVIAQYVGCPPPWPTNAAAKVAKDELQAADAVVETESKKRDEFIWARMDKDDAKNNAAHLKLFDMIETGRTESRADHKETMKELRILSRQKQQRH